MSDPFTQPRPTPRISCNDLAQYLVSSTTAQLGIARRAKYPSKPLAIRYKDVRPVVSTFLTDPIRNVKGLVAAERMFEQRAQDPATKPLMVDDAHQSIAVLHALQGMSNKLGQYTFRKAPQSQPKLLIAGVEVSVWAELLVSGVVKGVESAGAAVLRFTQSDSDGDTAAAKRREMGLYVATLVRLHAEAGLRLNAPLANRLCMSIDVQHGGVFIAPDANVRRMNDIESACRMIAAVWDGL